jgi:hypothetical protein
VEHKGVRRGEVRKCWSSRSCFNIRGDLLKGRTLAGAEGRVRNKETKRKETMAKETEALKKAVFLSRSFRLHGIASQKILTFDVIEMIQNIQRAG